MYLICLFTLSWTRSGFKKALCWSAWDQWDSALIVHELWTFYSLIFNLDFLDYFVIMFVISFYIVFNILILTYVICLISGLKKTKEILDIGIRMIGKNSILLLGPDIACYDVTMSGKCSIVSLSVVNSLQFGLLRDEVDL